MRVDNKSRISSETELRTVLQRAEEQGLIEPQESFFADLREPFGTLDLDQRWKLMQDLLTAERENKNNVSVNRGTLNSSNFARSDYAALRAMAAGQPQQDERIRDFIELVAHGGGGGLSAQESAEGLAHLYGPLAGDPLAQRRFIILAETLENAKTAIHVEPSIADSYDEATVALARVQAAQNRLGELVSENRPCWRTSANLQDMAALHARGVSWQQSGQMVERFLTAGVNESTDELERKMRLFYSGDAMKELVKNPPAVPWVNDVLDVEEGIASPLAPCKRAVSVAAVLAKAENPSQALECYGLIAPHVTAREGFDQTLQTFDYLKSCDIEHTHRFLQDYVMGSPAQEIIRKMKFIKDYLGDGGQRPGVQQGDDGYLIIGGVRVPINKQPKIVILIRHQRRRS